MPVSVHWKVASVAPSGSQAIIRIEVRNAPTDVSPLAVVEFCVPATASTQDVKTAARQQIASVVGTAASAAAGTITINGLGGANGQTETFG